MTIHNNLDLAHEVSHNTAHLLGCEIGLGISDGLKQESLFKKPDGYLSHSYSDHNSGTEVFFTTKGGKVVFSKDVLKAAPLLDLAREIRFALLSNERWADFYWKYVEFVKLDESEVE